MATIESEQVLAFLNEVGKRYPHFAKLTLLGGAALCVLGSPRPTLDIDYLGDDLQKDKLQVVMDEVAHEMGFDVDAVPAHGVIPLLAGGQRRNILVGHFGKIEVSIIDPYAIALSKLDRGFDTDIEDIIFLIQRGLITLPLLEKVMQDALPQAREFDLDASNMQTHLQAVREALK